MPNQRNLVALLSQLDVTVQVGARPVNAGDGVDISSWRVQGIYAGPRAAIMLDGTLAASLTGPAGSALGVELWGQSDAKWYLVGYMNNGSAIPIVGAGQGFAQEMDVIGIFDRLALAATVSAGVVTATLTPMDSYT